MNLSQHCTRDTVRKTPNSAWPLRNSAGLTWAEVRDRKASTNTPGRALT